MSAPDTLPGYRLPSRLVRDKEIDRIDRHCRAFIELSPGPRSSLPTPTASPTSPPVAASRDS